jgi:hypothetical protein
LFVCCLLAWLVGWLFVCLSTVFCSSQNIVSHPNVQYFPVQRHKTAMLLDGKTACSPGERLKSQHLLQRYCCTSVNSIWFRRGPLWRTWHKKWRFCSKHGHQLAGRPVWICKQ